MTSIILEPKIFLLLDFYSRNYKIPKNSCPIVTTRTTKVELCSLFRSKNFLPRDAPYFT